MRFSCSIEVDMLVEEGKEGKEKGTFFVHGFWQRIGV